MATSLGLDVGSNSIGSAWIDFQTGRITAGVSVFPAGVDESEDKRGDPKNVKRRMTRRTRITLARRSARKRQLRLKLISAGLLPRDAAEFKKLLEDTDPWDLRRRGLDEQLKPFEFGRVLLHLAQRRGAAGLKLPDPEDEEGEASAKEDGKVKVAISEVKSKIKAKDARTFGEFIALVQAERVSPISTEDRRPKEARKGPREWRTAVRNKAGSYEHCADRNMLRDEFVKLWNKQTELGGPLASFLTEELRLALDNAAGDAVWRHKGLLFGQRRNTWDLGTLGRCVLEPTERCAPHADRYASRYLVVETVNNLKIIEWGGGARPLTQDERKKIKDYLSGPLGIEKGKKRKGVVQPDKPKTTVTVTDLRNLMGWGKAGKTSQFRFNIEADTDWFSREIIHGAITPSKWDAMTPRVQEGINRAILKFDPDEEGDAEKLKVGVMSWAGLDEEQANKLVASWKKRPRPDAKRLNLSRRAVRNLLTLMDRDEPWPDPERPGQFRWLTQIEARKQIANNPDFKDVTTGQPLDEHARRRYATGAKGATARDRHYMKKHLLKKNREPLYAPDGLPLHEPPPAPLISNPVVRKAIHEVRRHLVEHLLSAGCKPDEIRIELSREAKMGKKDADRLLMRNRLRNRIRNSIIADLKLDALSSTQQRAAVDRVVLCVQQAGVCPLCGKDGLTYPTAANRNGCEVAHIIPRACGGHNGLANIVLAHEKCNREMGRRTPRQFWDAALKGGFDEGMRFVAGIYQDIERPKASEVKSLTGDALWKCYFTSKDDRAKLERFSKEVKDEDIQGMTQRQDAATKYAARQVMSYLADSLFDGGGLPERGGERRIFATDGIWTSRLRREWGLFFDPHGFKKHDLDEAEKHIRHEKDRGDHRHHAIDAVVIALCTRQVQLAWEAREKQADNQGLDTADEETMAAYRREHPIKPPAPFSDKEHLQDAVRKAVFGVETVVRPMCHRPVKRKLIGALHEETLFGPVLDQVGKLTEYYTAKKNVLALDPNHLRMPRPETDKEAIERLALRRQRERKADEKVARKWARAVVASKGYKPAIVDPPPGKSGIVRDVALRARMRQCLVDAGLNPDDFSANQLKKAVEAGALKQASGVPIRSVVLLRTMTDPVVIPRKQAEYATGRMVQTEDPAAQRAYVGGNNHHIEIRVARNKKGIENWSGTMVTAFEAARRKLAKLRAIRQAGIPDLKAFRKLPKADRATFSPTLREIEKAHPLVDRSDNQDGQFVMSLSEGETLFMKHKQTGQVGYFVVAKLDKPQSIIVVPHWDARAAGERKDAEGNKVPNSKREQFAVVPNDLKELAPPDHPHAVKVRVSPLGVVKILDRD
jgi:CRISPR-associated endonuclease Csn1